MSLARAFMTVYESTRTTSLAPWIALVNQSPMSWADEPGGALPKESAAAW